MNTLEIKTNIKINNFKELLKYAKKQFVNYEKIEGIDNWKEYSFSIDCPDDQLKFKDMLETRFIEELTEASIALYEEKNKEHFMEEIGDSFNFFISAFIMIDFDFNKVKKPEEIMEKEILIKNNILNWNKSYLFREFYEVIEKVGKCCNLLKNRPRAQNNYLVDMLSFEKNLKILWNSYFDMLKKLNITYIELYDIFIKKYEVNDFRIKSKY